MDERDRNHLTSHLTAIAKDLDVDAVFPYMLQEGIMKVCDVELIKNLPTSNQKNLKFVQLLLTKGPKAYGAFTSALQDTHNHLHELLTSTRNLTINDPHSQTVAQIQQELCEHYQHTLSNVSPIPWCEWFQLSLDKVFTSLRLVRGVQRKAFHSAVSSAKCGYKLDAEDLFKSHQECSEPKHILIEGHAGVGKSTLCHKLAFDWANGIHSNQKKSDVQKFDMVFLLKAADFSDTDHKNLIDVIYSELLPEDFCMPKTTFKTCLEDSQNKVLFIVDGYDEVDGGKCELLEKLIRSNVLNRCRVLVSSRPSYMLHLLKHFDSLYVAIGYDAQRRKEFIHKFAQELQVPISRFEPLLQRVQVDRVVKDICRNPLNLSILCLLCAEQNQTLPQTRTGLYQKVQEFIIERAIAKLQVNWEDVEKSVLEPIYKLSFEALGKRKGSLSEADLKKNGCDLKILSQVGFLTKEVNISRFKPVVQYVFSHKSFQEFFAAKYVASQSDDERHEFLVNHLGTRTYRSCCRCLFGLLSDNEEALVDFVKTWFQHAQYSPADHLQFSALTIFDVTECHKVHLLMQCLCELETIPDKVAKAVVAQIPSQVCFSFPLCTASCVEGLLIVCDLLRKYSKTIPDCKCEGKISIVVPAYCLDIRSDVFSTIFDKLTYCRCVDSVGLFNIAEVSQLSNALEMLRVGQLGSSVVHLKMRFLGIMQGTSEEFPTRPFGDFTQGIEIYHCSAPNMLNRLVSGIPKGKHLKTLVVAQCSINKESCEILSEKLESCTGLQNLSIIDHSLNVSGPQELAFLLSRVASLRQLKKFHISHLPSVTMDKTNSMDALSSLETILQENKLTNLALMHCVFTEELCRSLKAGIEELHTLEKLMINNCLLSDADAFDEILTAVKSLPQLKWIELQGMEWGENHIKLVGDIFKVSSTIAQVLLSKLNCNLIHGVTEGLTENSSITSLTLRKLGFSGDYVTQFANALQKLPELREVRLSMHPGNYLVDQEHISLWQAIENCKKLEKLSLRHTGIEDHLVKHFCKVLENNPQITHVDLHQNMISAEAFGDLVECLEKRPNKLLYLDISDCLLTDSSPVVERLRNCCCFLRINWF